MQLELLAAEVEAPGHRQLLGRAEAERPLAADVVLGVGVAQFALSRSRLGSQSRRGRTAHPEGEVGKGEPSEQVVEVAVGGQQGLDLESGLARQRGERLELVGEVGRVDEHGLGPGARVARLGSGRGSARIDATLTRGSQQHGVGLPHAARDHERVGMDCYHAHERRLRLSARSAAARPR